MKPSAKVRLVAMAFYLITAIVLQASGQTPPAATPAQSQTQARQNSKGAEHAEAGALIGAGLVIAAFTRRRWA